MWYIGRDDNKAIKHYGIKGQKWGIRRFQNPDGTLTPEGKKRYMNYSSNDTVFVSGKVSYDKELSKEMASEMDKMMNKGCKIIVGDAPGADTRVQEYMASKGYKNVTVYTADPKVRNNVGNWKVKKIEGKGADDREIRRQKDIAMTNECTRAFAIMPEDDRPDSAMSLNIKRLMDAGKISKTYDYTKEKWIFR